MADQVYIEDVKVGDEIPKLVKNCNTMQLVMWAAGSGDYYQIHYDKDFANLMGLPGVIAYFLKNLSCLTSFSRPARGQDSPRSRWRNEWAPRHLP